MSAVFRIDLSKLNGTLDRAVRAGVANAATHVRTVITESLQTKHGGKSSPPGTPPSRQKGGLSRSIAVHMVSGRIARVAANTPYALIHEVGGVIRPVKGRYLWQPVGAKKSESPTAVVGSMKAKKGEYIMIPRRSAGFFVVRKSKSGRKTKTGLIYILSLAITMPKRPYMKPGLEKSKAGLLDAFKLGAAKHMGAA